MHIALFISQDIKRVLILSIETINDQELGFNHELRYINDFITDAAEVLNGSMRTPTEYQFDYDNQDIIASDGSSLGKIMLDSVTHAEQMVQTSPQLSFELRRRKIEYDEFGDMLQMMNGIAPNTMVVVSDFPPELMNYPKDVGGYNVQRRQTFLRVIQKQPDGSVQMYSQSLDGSNRKALEGLYRLNGFVAEEGELLGQRMRFDSDENGEEIVERLMNEYDRSLHEQSGLNFRAGIILREKNVENTFEFVKTQQDLINLAVNYRKNGTYEENRYNIMALISERFEKYSKSTEVKDELFPEFNNNQNNTAAGLVINQSQIAHELVMAGNRAAVSGKTFNGCGMTSSTSLTAQEELENAGVGNKTEGGEESYSFDSYQYCVSCQAPPDSEDDKKKWCGPCGLCRSCDKKAGGKG